MTCNSTDLTKNDIKFLVFIGKTVNKWRGRNINLYRHPSNPSNVISIGTTFDGSMTVIADETKDVWSIALDYIANGRVLVTQ